MLSPWTPLLRHESTFADRFRGICIQRVALIYLALRHEVLLGSHAVEEFVFLFMNGLTRRFIQDISATISLICRLVALDLCFYQGHLHFFLQGRKLQEPIRARVNDDFIKRP